MVRVARGRYQVAKYVALTSPQQKAETDPSSEPRQKRIAEIRKGLRSEVSWKTEEKLRTTERTIKSSSQVKSEERYLNY